MPHGTGFSFGTFHLDPSAKRLMRDGQPVALSPRQFDLLCALVSNAGEVLSKDQLIQVAWRDVAVTDNSLEQAVSGLRKTLGQHASSEYIKTEARRGYRFAVPVTRIATRESDAALEALLAPHRAWIEGRAALETLERDHIVHARRVFAEVLERMPDLASAHVGLANACAMQFEMTRADRSRDLAALELAVEHAREACRLDPGYGEGWATLGFVLDRTGRHDDALAAGRRAVTIEPDNWRHHLRLGYTAWGEERLRAAGRTLALLPGFPLAHWLAATVHVGRGSAAEAARELDAAIPASVPAGARFSPVAVNWLRGLVHFAADNDDAALAAFERELPGETSGHLYARECCANTWYAIGALHLARGRLDAATAAFEQTLGRITIHPMARVGLAAAGRKPDGAGVLPDALASAAEDSFEAVQCRAAALVLGLTDSSSPPSDRVQQAVRLLDDALSRATSPSDGWLLPLEPLIRTCTAPQAWAPVLARLRQRAA